MYKYFAVIIPLVFFCNIQITSGDREKLKNECLELLNVNKLFTPKPFVFYKALLKANETLFQKFIDLNYAEIKCSYILGAKIYMRLMEDFFIDKNLFEPLLSNRQKFFENLKFTREATLIIQSMHYYDKLKNTDIKDVLWLFYMYTMRVSNYVYSVLFKGHDTKSQTTISNIHNSMKNIINDIYNSDECKTAIETYYWNKEFKFNLSERCDVLAAKKVVILSSLLSNADMKKDKEGYEEVNFLFENLTFQNAILDNDLLDTLNQDLKVQIKWEKTIKDIKDQLCLVKCSNEITLSHQILLLTKTQNFTIEILKVFFIRLILEYYELLKKSSILFKKNVINSNPFMFHNDISKYLSNFMDYLDLNEDEDLILVQKIVTASFYSYLKNNYVSSIKKILQNISSKLNNINLSNTSIENVDKNIKRNHLIDAADKIKKFLLNLTTRLEGINFKVIRSFMHVIDVEYFKLLSDSEN